MALTFRDLEANNELYTYGSNVANFLKKARDWKQGRTNAKEPYIVIIGDSITGGWGSDVKTYFNETWNISLDNIAWRWYGGYGIESFLPFFENECIYPNPDLVIFGEYDNNITGMDRMHLVEQSIQLLRKFTTADIAINTWALDAASADAYFTGTALTETSYWTALHFYRDLARVYNCELIDFQKAIRNYIDLGNNPADGHDGAVHWDGGTWYEDVFLPELKKHFRDSDWIENSNMSWTRHGNREELIYLSNRKRFESFYDDRVSFKTVGNWNLEDDVVNCSTATEYVDITLKDAIGFELIHNSTVGELGVQIDIGAGLVNPSTLTFRGKPLQYATEIRNKPNVEAVGSTWLNKRVAMKAVVNANILAAGVLEEEHTIIVTSAGTPQAINVGSNIVEIDGDHTAYLTNGTNLFITGNSDAANNKQYRVDSVNYNGVSSRTEITLQAGFSTINSATLDGYVIDASGVQLMLCDLKDSGGTVLDTFIPKYEAASAYSGDLTIPITYNGENNYRFQTGNIIEVGDEYAFKIKSNWENTFDLSDTHVKKVFGFEKTDCTVRFTLNSGECDLIAIRALKGN